MNRTSMNRAAGEKQLNNPTRAHAMNRRGMEIAPETLLWLVLLVLLALVIMGILFRYNFFRGTA